MKTQSILVFPLFAMITLAACATDATDDPLAGTWKNTECFGTPTKPTDVESCTTEITFTNDLALDLKAEWVSLAATATNPGCTTTKRVSGQEWSTSHEDETFTVSGKASATVERSNCIQAADDSAAATTNDITIASGEIHYTLSGDTLTITSSGLQGVYTR
jgi:hypothetical protein